MVAVTLIQDMCEHYKPYRQTSGVTLESLWLQRYYVHKGSLTNSMKVMISFLNNNYSYHTCTLYIVHKTCFNSRIQDQ